MPVFAAAGSGGGGGARVDGIVPGRRREERVQEKESFVLPLLDLCRAAGELICEHYRAPDAGHHRSKADDSPLTRADLASHELLCRRLRELDPAIPVLSEESAPAELVGRRQWRRCWVVDPLDGTKEFLARTGEFTINVALVSDHRPVLGLLYLPLSRTACVGIPGAWARRYRSEGGGWSSTPLQGRPLEAGRELVVLVSRRHRNRRLQACMTRLQELWGPVTRHDAGSALKFCQLAAGEGDFYPRFSPCSEWDTAAGQALVEAAGGCVVGLDGEPLRYNCRDTLISPDFYAIANRNHPLWRQLLATPTPTPTP